jgi:hypothetical protein
LEHLPFIAILQDDAHSQRSGDAVFARNKGVQPDFCADRITEGAVFPMGY